MICIGGIIKHLIIHQIFLLMLEFIIIFINIVKIKFIVVGLCVLQRLEIKENVDVLNTMMDLKRQQSMDADEKENNEMKYVRFWGGNGYCGCDYEEYEKFEDDVTEEVLNDYSKEIGYENAETYEWVVLRYDSDWESEEEREEYYEDALDYCGWEYCTQEEFLENTEGD